MDIDERLLRITRMYVAGEFTTGEFFAEIKALFQANGVCADCARKPTCQNRLKIPIEAYGCFGCPMFEGKTDE